MAAKYQTSEQRRLAIAQVHALVPAGACVIDMIDVRPDCSRDPMGINGHIGLKWIP